MQIADGSFPRVLPELAFAFHPYLIHCLETATGFGVGFFVCVCGGGILIACFPPGGTFFFTYQCTGVCAEMQLGVQRRGVRRRQEPFAQHLGRSPASWPRALAENSPQVLVQFIPWVPIIKGLKVEV